MLLIRAAQLDALAESRLDGFRPWMLAHLRQHFGQQLRERSDEDLLASIEEGLRNGRAFGLDLPTSLCKFIDLHVLFGAGFEHDLGHTWVARALQSPDASTPDGRVALMARYASEWLAKAR